MKLKFLIVFALATLYCLPVLGQNRKVDSLRALVDVNKKDSTVVDRLLEISLLLNTTEPKAAQEYAQQAIDLASEINYKRGMAYGYKNLGLPLYFKGELNNELVSHWETSLDIFTEMGDKQGISNLQSNLGSIYQTKGDDPTALEYFLKSARIAEEIGDSLRIATAKLNIGSVYSNEKVTYEEAFEAYKESKVIFDNIGYHEGVGYAAINMGELYIKDNNPKSAILILNESLEALKKADGNIAHSLMLIGKAYAQMNNFLQAEAYLERAIAVAKEKESKMEESKAYIALGDLNNDLNRLPTAETNYFQGLALTETTKVFRDKRDVFKGLAKLYSKSGDFENAYTYQKLFSAMRDTIRKGDYEKTIGDLRFQFDIEKKEKEIELLNRDNELNKIAIEKAQVTKRYFFAISALLLAIVLGVIFQYGYIKRSNRRLAEERNKAENILLNILPKETAEELKHSGKIRAKEFNQITVLFTDFKEFSIVAEKIKAEDLVKSVDYYFSKFDEITEKHNLEKIKTIGDSYMCAGGLPTENKTNAEDAFNAALEILNFVKETENNPPEGIYPFQIRIGINTGPVVAGVVGTKKFQYDIWGSSVNIASRMESNSLPGRINVSENTYQLLKDKAKFNYRGIVKVKNSQNLKMYFLEEEEHLA